MEKEMRVGENYPFHEIPDGAVFKMEGGTNLFVLIKDSYEWLHWAKETSPGKWKRRSGKGFFIHESRRSRSCTLVATPMDVEDNPPPDKIQMS